MRLLLLTVILVAGPGLAHCRTSTAPAPHAAQAQTWQDGDLLFADEFNSGQLDRSKWNVIGPDFWVNNEQQAYIDAPETIRFIDISETAGADGGALALQPVYRKGFETPDGRKVDFVSGRIDTRDRFEFTYGRAAARP
jgi:beta-glucanase (GH16 family)